MEDTKNRERENCFAKLSNGFFCYPFVTYCGCFSVFWSRNEVVILV